MFLLINKLLINSKKLNLIDKIQIKSKNSRVLNKSINFDIDHFSALSRCDRNATEATLKERLRLLELKLERKNSALDDLKRENIRLREASERRKRREGLSSYQQVTKFGEKVLPTAKSLGDLTSPKHYSKKSSGKLSASQHTQEDGSQYDSEDAGYCSSLRSFSESGFKFLKNKIL